MPVHLKPLAARFVTSFRAASGDVRELRNPHALASSRQLWRLNEAGLLALVHERPPITMGRAAGALEMLERRNARRAAPFEREAKRLRTALEDARRDIQAHDAAIAFEETGSWQEAARVTGYRDGSAARQAVELRTDYLDEEGARLASNRQHRIGRLSGLSEAQGRRVDRKPPP